MVIRKMKRQSQKQVTSSRRSRPLSEKVAEMAADFFRLEDTIDELQRRLNLACTAWNLACISPALRQWRFEEEVDNYIERNPNASQNELEEFAKDLALLIERKLKLFPSDYRQVVSSRVVKDGAEFRIEVSSATLQ